MAPGRRTRLRPAHQKRPGPDLLFPIQHGPSPAHAEERIDSLKNFTGIWAPAEGSTAPANVACKKELSSRGHQNPCEARPCELLGICERGIDYLYQSVYCDAANITPHGTSFEFNELCTTKGEYIDEFHSRIIVTGERSIVLSRTPTKSGGGYSSSPNARYIRCNRTYSCERWY